MGKSFTLGKLHISFDKRGWGKNGTTSFDFKRYKIVLRTKYIKFFWYVGPYPPTF